MAEPTVTLTEEQPSAAEDAAARDLAWTKNLDAPIMLVAPLLAGWLFMRHHRRVKAAFAAQSAKAIAGTKGDTAGAVPLADATAAATGSEHG